MPGAEDNAHSGGLKVFASAMSGAVITPSDDTELDFCYIWVGTTGDLALRLWEQQDTTITLNDVPSGSLLPLRVYKVMAATTALQLVGLN